MLSKLERIFHGKCISDISHGYMQITEEEACVKYWYQDGREFELSFNPNMMEKGVFLFFIKNGYFSII
tara:strand:+ start:312 stop:515 length:204 start_codon:yes stop_codon:yes gene_type:complete